MMNPARAHVAHQAAKFNARSMRRLIARRIDRNSFAISSHMPHYKYRFIEMFGVIGRGTPEDPGSDYCLVCAIEAANESDALAWGLKVHSDFNIARTMFTDCPSNGILYRDGEIDGEVDADELLRSDPTYAICSVGQFPDWIQPWRSCQADGVRPASQAWFPRNDG
ncbi:MAG: hypothetical protein JNM43_00480 [Planctomycetaceae bacterium]|nr:hypothetical protein [Planctomycetaceae bacterium]